MSYAVVIFPSTHDAIRGEQILRPLMPVTLMPTPRRFSESCGISLRFDDSLIEDMKKAIEENHVKGEIHILGDEDENNKEGYYYR
ncbi:MAG: DUF3343 domain-containing protein [Firmicutes bacterium]|nr:DUF3343 domain-containing protein [Bacillota bacterium]